MAKQRKRRAPRAPFIVTVAATSAVALAALPGCGSSVVTGESGECPEVMPSAGSSCAVEGQSCSFGTDECGSPIAMACQGGTWAWESISSCNPPPPPAECPVSAPNNGDPCFDEGMSCVYTIDDGCGPIDTPATCQGGVWSLGISTCNPPPPEYCYSLTTEADCNLYGDICRWLVPGCADPSTPPLPLAQAGCFPSYDCASSAECAAGTTCEQRVYNPCVNLPCDACGAVAMLCVAP